ncbi:hypothetical protein KEJ35_07490 [Candidatus Bathyarchaeota archaeon]|nr:hypothetical protein [Candidatus Bathyarchaeota archaeon]
MKEGNVKKQSIERCPRCGEKLSKKASIRDYSYMFILVCEKCGYTTTEKPVSI